MTASTKRSLISSARPLPRTNGRARPPLPINSIIGLKACWHTSTRSGRMTLLMISRRRLTRERNSRNTTRTSSPWSTKRWRTRPRLTGVMSRITRNCAIACQFLLLLALCLPAPAAVPSTNYPAPHEADFVIRDFHFRSGESLPELRLHYLTFGTPVRDTHGVVRNAILILHGTGGSCSQFLRSDFANELYGKGQPFDVTRYYLIIPDGIGHGKSSKPSDGLHAKFPKYGYQDMIAAQHQLLTDGLRVNHLRLVFGTSMGGMHTWLWGENYPDFMDALMPMASLPTQISGRNRVWRRVVIDAIRNDPEWHNGEYK